MTTNHNGTTAIPRSPYAQLIRDARETAGLSQHQLARAIGTNPNYIWQIEAGLTASGKPETYARIAEALSIDIDEIYAASGKVPPDLLAAITTSADTIRLVRRALETP